MKKIIFLPETTDRYAAAMEIQKMDSDEQGIFTLYYLPKGYIFPRNTVCYMLSYFLEKNIDQYNIEDWEEIRTDLIKMIGRIESGYVYIVIREESYGIIKDLDLPFDDVTYLRSSKDELEIIRNAYLVPIIEEDSFNFEIESFERFTEIIIESYAAIFSFGDYLRKEVKLSGALTEEEIKDCIDYKPPETSPN